MAKPRCSPRHAKTVTVSPTKPTIKDVAAAAGVSKSLVSLALRDAPGVSPETKARILGTAAELGYRSNTWARALAEGKSQVVGILLNDLHSAYHTDIVEGIETAANQAGLTTILSHGHRDSALLTTRLAHLQDLGVDGVIVVSALLPRDVLAASARRGPLVVVGRPAEIPSEVGGVWNNDELGAQLAVEHLAALGHTRIAHLSGSVRPASRARLGSFHATMTSLGLPEPHQVFHDPIALVQVARSQSNGPTAVFASNDVRAARLLGAASDEGLVVPEELSIVGYDNTDLAQLLRPALTSIDQPRHEMGGRALRMLTDLLGGAAARIEVVAPSIVVRASTQRPVHE